MIGNYIGAPIGGVISIADASDAAFSAAGSAASSVIGAALAAASFAGAGSATALWLSENAGSVFAVEGASTAEWTARAYQSYVQAKMTARQTSAVRFSPIPRNS